jgi:hypothetical protein
MAEFLFGDEMLDLVTGRFPVLDEENLAMSISARSQVAI